MGGRAIPAREPPQRAVCRTRTGSHRDGNGTVIHTSLGGSSRRSLTGTFFDPSASARAKWVCQDVRKWAITFLRALRPRCCSGSSCDTSFCLARILSLLNASRGPSNGGILTRYRATLTKAITTSHHPVFRVLRSMTIAPSILPARRHPRTSGVSMFRLAGRTRRKR